MHTLQGRESGDRKEKEGEGATEERRGEGGECLSELVMVLTA